MSRKHSGTLSTSNNSKRKSDQRHVSTSINDISALSLSNSEIQGNILWAKGKTKFRSNYAFLNKENIYFFKDDAGKRSKFIINLRTAYTAIEDVNHKKLSLKLVPTLRNEKPITLKFKSEEDFMAWNSAIEKTLSELQDLTGQYKAGERRNENSLYVKVAEGKDIDGTIDCYVSIYSDTYQRGRTTTSYKQEKPVFDQEFDFILDDQVQTISICLKDENKKEIIGQVTMPITELTDQNPHQHWINFLPPSGMGLVNGEIHFAVAKRENNTIQLSLLEISNLHPLEIENRFLRLKVGDEFIDIPFSSKLPTTEEIIMGEILPLDVYITTYERCRGEDRVMGHLDLSIYELTKVPSIQNSFVLRSTAEEANLGSFRVDVQFHQSHILEDNKYDALLIALMANKMAVPDKFATVNIVNEKVVSECLVKAFEVKKSGIHFLKHLITKEIEQTPDPEIIFRGNTLATRSVDSYMKLIGEEYLKHVLQDVIYEIIANSPKKSCEMDIYRLDPNIKDGKKQKLTAQNLNNLQYYTQRFFDSITENLSVMPMNIRIVFEFINTELEKQYPGSDIARFRGIGGFIFLRFFGPCILTPKLYGLVDEQPSPLVARDLTLIAKTLQNAANLVSFGKKEPFMEPVNEYIHELFEPVKQYFTELCVVPEDISAISINTKMQLKFGREMSRVHHYVAGLIEPLQEQYPGDPDIEKVEEAIKGLNEKIILSKHELNTGEIISSVERNLFNSVN